MSSSDFDGIDYFRAKDLWQDPYPYYEYLRAQGPAWREPHHGVVMVTGYEEAMAVYNDPSRFSSCNAVAGPWGEWPVPLEGDDINDIIEEYRDVLAVQRSAAVVRSAEAHRAPRAVDAADHTEAPQGERGVHVAARRSSDRRVRRPRRMRVRERVREARSRCSSSPTCSACRKKTTTPCVRSCRATTGRRDSKVRWRTSRWSSSTSASRATSRTGAANRATTS